MTSIVGWDIGAVNVKAGWVADEIRTASQPFEIWRDRNHLNPILKSVFHSVTQGLQPDAMAITMTAELSDAFSTKRDGVEFILRSLASTFPETGIYVFTVSGNFVSLKEALTRPLECAASNWLATAQWIAQRISNCLIIDVGSTTTDILPVINGKIAVAGRTDLGRLASGELVYTGALRTNLAAIVQSIPVGGKMCRVSSEYFAISGDVHLVMGKLKPEEYTCPSPDGRPPSTESARGRIARLVCADSEMLSALEIDEMARYIWGRQVLQICEGIQQVLSRLPSLRTAPAIVLGSGSFLGEAAAKSVCLEIGKAPGILLDGEMSFVAPCMAVAQLLAGHLKQL